MAASALTRYSIHKQLLTAHDFHKQQPTNQHWEFFTVNIPNRFHIVVTLPFLLAVCDPI